MANTCFLGSFLSFPGSFLGSFLSFLGSFLSFPGSFLGSFLSFTCSFLGSFLNFQGSSRISPGSFIPEASHVALYFTVNNALEILFGFPIAEVPERGGEGHAVALENRRGWPAVRRKLSRKAQHASETVLFHQIKLLENSGNDRIAADRRDCAYITVLNRSFSVGHSARGAETYAVIKNVDPQHSSLCLVITVYEMVCRALKDCPVGVLRDIQPVSRQLVPASCGIGPDEVCCHFKHQENISAVFVFVDGIAIFGPVPSAAD